MDSININSQNNNVLTFKELDDDQFNELCKIISNKEFDNVELHIKELQYQYKVKIFKFVLSNANTSNSSIILNIINLIKNYNNFNDEFFSEEIVIFKDIEEFLNLKLDLRLELQNYINDLASWYLSLFLYAHKTATNDLENYDKMPKSYEHIILSQDLITMSGICSKADTECVKLHKNCILGSYETISLLSDKMQLTNKFLNSIMK